MGQIAETAPGSSGCLIAVGVGPGDPELLTLKAVREIRAADVVVTPVGDRSDSSIALSIIEDHLDRSRQQVLTRTFPMRQPAEVMAKAWREIAAEIAELVHAGQKVVFITLGDPMLYSTFLYLQFELNTDYPDVPISTVPGISSIFAAAGNAQLPLGLGDDALTIIPATSSEGKLKAALAAGGTVVFLKVYRAFSGIKSLLQQVGLERQAIYVRRLGLEGEKIIRDLADVNDEDLDYLSLILVRSGGCDD